MVLNWPKLIAATVLLPRLIWRRFVLSCRTAEAWIKIQNLELAASLRIGVLLFLPFAELSQNGPSIVVFTIVSKVLSISNPAPHPV